jgi:hypothetical protein
MYTGLIWSTIVKSGDVLWTQYSSFNYEYYNNFTLRVLIMKFFISPYFNLVGYM